MITHGEDIGKCTINREVVLEKVNPTLIPSAKPRPERKERSA